MKLRIKSNSVRLRLGPRDVQQLLRDGELRETTRFGPGDAQQFHYRPVVEDEAARVSARFEGSTITVVLPADAANAWAANDELSISADQPAGDAHILHLLIEKDLECIDGPPEPGQDVYPNPAANCEV